MTIYDEIKQAVGSIATTYLDFSTPTFDLDALYNQDELSTDQPEFKKIVYNHNLLVGCFKKDITMNNIVGFSKEDAIQRVFEDLKTALNTQISLLKSVTVLQKEVKMPAEALAATNILKIIVEKKKFQITSAINNLKEKLQEMNSLNDDISNEIKEVDLKLKRQGRTKKTTEEELRNNLKKLSEALVAQRSSIDKELEQLRKEIIELENKLKMIPEGGRLQGENIVAIFLQHALEQQKQLHSYTPEQFKKIVSDVYRKKMDKASFFVDVENVSHLRKTNAEEKSVGAENAEVKSTSDEEKQNSKSKILMNIQQRLTDVINDYKAHCDHFGKDRADCLIEQFNSSKTLFFLADRIASFLQTGKAGNEHGFFSWFKSSVTLKKNIASELNLDCSVKPSVNDVYINMIQLCKSRGEQRQKQIIH